MRQLGAFLLAAMVTAASVGARPRSWRRGGPWPTAPRGADENRFLPRRVGADHGERRARRDAHLSRDLPHALAMLGQHPDLHRQLPSDHPGPPPPPGTLVATVGTNDGTNIALTQNGQPVSQIPAGTYTIEAWHDKLGTRTESVTLAEKEAKTVSFAFKATAP